MKSYCPSFLPLDKNQLNKELFYEELIDATAKLEVYKEKLKDTKLDANWFLPTLQQKEALYSAKLEGTQATLDDVLYNQIVPDDKNKDLQEIQNYFTASLEGYQYLKKFPISQEFIKHLHKVILSGNVRGNKTDIGEYRKKQNYVGKIGMNKITYVPPEPEKVEGLIENLISYINHPSDSLRPLVRCAVIHAQFETIHPFMDGNGRVGRILIPLYLYMEHQIDLPCFFISEALERDKFKYYSLLNGTREEGKWEEWIQFFLKAVIRQCDKYIDMVKQINELYDNHIALIKELGSSSQIIDIINLLYQYPVMNSNIIKEKTNIPSATITRYLKGLTELGILYPDEKKRNTNYYYYDLLNIIDF